MFAEKRQLRIPGPTPVPPQIARAGAKPMMGPAWYLGSRKRVAAKPKTVFRQKDVFILVQEQVP